MSAQQPTAPAPNKRALQKAETRDRLLESALHLFGTQGFPETSIEEVAAGAGLSRVGFYLHFSSLTDLARELVRPAVAELFAHYGALDAMDPTTDNLRAWSRAMLEVWRGNSARIRVGEYIIEMDPETRGVWASRMDDLAVLMPHYVARWEAGSHRALGLLRLTALLVQHERLCYLTMAAATPYDEQALIDLLVEECWVLLSREVGAGAPYFGRPASARGQTRSAASPPATARKAQT